MSAPTLVGLYRPGRSVVHRLPAGVKLALLVAAGVSSLWWTTPLRTGVVLAVMALGYLAARVPAREASRLLRPMLFLAVPLALFHALVTDMAAAFSLVGALLALVMLANLVTLTTRSADLVDVVVRCAGPLRPIGVDPERVGVLLLLGIRAVPVVIGLATGIRDAQRARGLTSSPTAFAVPLVVGALRHADRVGDALAARGLDD